MAKYERYFREHFYRNYQITDNDCWEWQGTKNAKGYGKIVLKKKIYFCHRVSYFLNQTNTIEQLIEALKTKQIVRHSCHNTSCINPAHLKIGTQKQNIEDKLNAGRQPVGEQCHNSKLIEKEVLDIRRQYASGVIIAELSRRFNIGEEAISDIVKRKSWKHI